MRDAWEGGRQGPLACCETGALELVAQALEQLAAELAKDPVEYVRMAVCEALPACRRTDGLELASWACRAHQGQARARRAAACGAPPAWCESGGLGPAARASELAALPEEEKTP